MNNLSVQQMPIKIGPIRLKTSGSELSETIEKIATVAINFFKKRALEILPILTKITRSKYIAECILDGAFACLALWAIFITLGLPRNNIGLNYVSGHLFRKHFSLFR